VAANADAAIIAAATPSTDAAPRRRTRALDCDNVSLLSRAGESWVTGLASADPT
jgi:hypothetical protein